MDLYSKIGDMTYDGLISDLTIPVIAGTGTITKLSSGSTDVSLSRGTILYRKADGTFTGIGDTSLENTFSATGDGSKTVFTITGTSGSAEKITEVKVDGTAVTTGWSFDPHLSTLTFTTAPENTKAIAVKYWLNGFGANAILAEDTTITDDADVTISVYLSGTFNLSKCSTLNSYSLTVGDKEKLRQNGIIFRTAQAAQA